MGGGQSTLLQRRRTLLAKKSSLPAGLQEVEYLESTGEQWIDTLLNVSEFYDIDMSFSITDISSSIGQGIIWTDNGNSDDRNRYGIQIWDGMFYVSGINPISAVLQNHKYHLSKIFDTWYLDDKVYPDTQYPQNLRLPIFAWMRQNSILFYSYMKLFYLDIGTVRNYIPCYTTTSTWVNELGNQVPTGTKGMYDLVNGVLYTNRGTGADFIAGPDV